MKECTAIFMTCLLLLVSSCSTRLYPPPQLKGKGSYLIKGRMDLNGSVLTLRKGVKLVFEEGGTICNGKIIGNNTVIKGDSNNVLFENVILAGTFEADTAYSVWFNAQSDCVVDENAKYLAGTDNQQAFKNLFLFKNISIKKGNYMLTGRLECLNDQTIDGNGSTLKFLRKGECIVLNGNPIHNVSICDLHITGSKSDYSEKTEYWHGLIVYYAEDVYLDNLIIEACRGDGIYIGGAQANGGDDKSPKGIHLKNVRALRNHRQGMSITRCDGVTVENCEFSESLGTLPNSGVDIEPNLNLDQKWFNECKNIHFVNCTFRDNANPGLILSARNMDSDSLDKLIYNVSIKSCSFINNGICVYGVNGLKINDCILVNGGIGMVAYGRVQDVALEDVAVDFNRENDACGFQLSLMQQPCHNITLSNFKASNCGVFGVYVTRGTFKDSYGNPTHQLDGLKLSNIQVSNCCNSIFVSEYVKNVTYKEISITNNGIDSKGNKMKSRYGSNLEFMKLDDQKTRVEK